MVLDDPLFLVSLKLILGPDSAVLLSCLVIIDFSIMDDPFLFVLLKLLSER